MDPYTARSQFVHTSHDDRDETMYVLRTIPLLPRSYLNPPFPAIESGASDQATLYTIVTPVGPYFSTTSKGVSLLAVAD